MQPRTKLDLALLNSFLSTFGHPYPMSASQMRISGTLVGSVTEQAFTHSQMIESQDPFQHVTCYLLWETRESL
jgi:hypothetical protein